MATIAQKKRMAALENKQRRAKPAIDTPEFRVDCNLVSEYFESNGRKTDTKPRDDFTEIQREILAAVIKFEIDYC